MAYITSANTYKIIFKSNISNLNLKGEVYRIPIYFFNNYEKNALLAIQELLKDPEEYFTKIYQPYEAVDTYTYVHEGQQPAYHNYSCCPRLQSSYQNFKIPFEITERGREAVKEFRSWFAENQDLFKEDPKSFIEKMQARFRITREIKPEAIEKENSGFTKAENLSLEELEDRIDKRIKEAGRFYYANDKNKNILRKFSRFAGYISSVEEIYNNDTGYPEDEVKELLKFYDTKFKKPLKKDLIEYYRLKLNPDLEMKGYFLEKLGFKPCGHCHDEEYEPENASETYDKDLPF